MRVLVTSIGSTPSIGVVKFIKATKQSIDIFGTDINSKDRIAGSSFVDYFFKVPLNTDPDYLTVLLKIVKEESIQMLIPIHDYEIEVLSKEAEKFKKLGCTIIASEYLTIKSVNNKYAFAQLLSDSNILTPETYSIDQWGTATFNDSDSWILKPLRGVSSRGIQKGNTNEIRVFLEKESIGNSNYLIQRFILGKEYTVDIFVKNKKLYCNVPRVRDEIREGICYKCHTEANEKFQKPLNNIINLYDFYGPINLQFIESSDHNLYCIECNPRFGASSVTTLYAGINLFQFILDDFENRPLSIIDNYKSIYMTRFWEEVIYEN